jgi:hypothetical protein
MRSFGPGRKKHASVDALEGETHGNRKSDACRPAFLKPAGKSFPGGIPPEHFGERVGNSGRRGWERAISQARVATTTTSVRLPGNCGQSRLREPPLNYPFSFHPRNA